jgi:hypothetical protein
MGLRHDLERTHEILLRQSRLLFAVAIAITVGALVFSIRLIFVTPLGPSWLWALDIVILVLFWASHIAYQLRRSAR